MTVITIQLDYYTSGCLTTCMRATMAELYRIEDTDRNATSEDGEPSQLENLRWLGMDWDESPETLKTTAERLELYQSGPTLG